MICRLKQHRTSEEMSESLNYFQELLGDDMYQKLLDAYNGLVILNDKSGLTDLISKADQLQEKDYTKDSWKQLVEALTQAKEVSGRKKKSI